MSDPGLLAYQNVPGFFHIGNHFRFGCKCSALDKDKLYGRFETSSRPPTEKGGKSVGGIGSPSLGVRSAILDHQRFANDLENLSCQFVSVIERHLSPDEYSPARCDAEDSRFLELASDGRL